MRLIIIASLVLGFTGCMGMPEKVEPVSGFEVERYLGKWYEIARLEHRFERGLDHVTAEYSVREDGGIRVRNRGYSPAEDKWKEAVGKAYLAGEPDKGYFKVSFFGPFYSSYVIFGLDEEYQYAFVSGYKTGYLWLLSRTPTVGPEVIERFEQEAAKRGFDTSELVYVDQQ